MFRFIYYQLLILQLEEYDMARFLKAFFAKPIPPKQYRKKLVFTPKIIILIIISFLLFIFLLTTSYYLLATSYWLLVIGYLLILYLYLPLLLTTHYSLLPFDYLLKTIIIILAKSKLRQYPNLKIIGLAGSYGKTSFKEMSYTVLSQKFNVVKTPESFNTPLGISQTILKKINSSTQIFIVEMGEYYRGDIKNICQIARPNIAIITGINEAHLERLKTLDNTVKTIFEIAQNMDEKGLLVINEKNELIKKNYRVYLKSQEVYLYGINHVIKKIEFREDLPGYSFEFSGLSIVNILGEYNLNNLDAIIRIAMYLGMKTTEIKNSFNKIKPVMHRLQPIFNRQNNILTIDDSYNGNPDGVEEAVKTLNLFKDRRKVYVTPGLVEMGEKKKEVHEQIGKSLSYVADLVILTKNSVTPDIEKGLLENNFPKEKIIMFNSGNETYRKLGKIIKSGDVVLLQNDWTDNYK